MARKLAEHLLKGQQEMRKVAQEIIYKEMNLREKAEEDRDIYDRDYYAKELEEERRLRLHAEYVKEYYEMQIVQHGLNDMVVD